MVASFSSCLDVFPWVVLFLAGSNRLPLSRCHPIQPSTSSHFLTAATSTLTPVSINTTTGFRDPCAQLPLTPQVWQALNLDDYLLNFPGGKNLSLEAYAEQVGATNFECGIGKMCSPEQKCMPVKDRDWYILVAVQNWNIFTNNLYQATGFSLEIVQGLSTSIVNEVAPHETDKVMIAYTLLGLLAGLCYVVPGFVYPEGISFFGEKVWPFVQGGTGFAAGGVSTYHNIYEPLPPDQFHKTTDVQYLLSKTQAETQERISSAAINVIRSGISTVEGLFGVLRNGLFLNNHGAGFETSEGEIQEALSRVATARLLAAIWKATNYFIVRGSTPCTQDGPNGALAGSDVLSYCSRDGIMMNIIQSKKGKIIDRFPYAHLISAKYNFTTEYLVETSWTCQKKYGVYSYDPYQNSPIPPDTRADCLVNLAVCDLTREDLQREFHRKGILKACRKLGKVPGI